MKGKSLFTTVLYIVFSVGLLAGVAFIANTKPSNPGGVSYDGLIEIWGTFPEEQVIQSLSSFVAIMPDVQPFYTQKDQKTFENDYVRAIASGSGPDMIFVTDETIASLQQTLYQVPYSTVSRVELESWFGESAIQTFADSGGAYAFPVSYDPLVLYYNKDILAASFLLKPATTWEELFVHTKKIVLTTPLNEVRRAGLAIGTYDNVRHAADILSFILLQGGVDVGRRVFDENSKKDSFVVGLNEQSFDGLEYPAQRALALYLSFADPTQKQYGWSSANDKNRKAFLSGDVAYYIGYASEYRSFFDDNPNLNFGVNILPQISDEGKKITYGRTYALGVSKLSTNLDAAFVAAFTLSQFGYAEQIAMALDHAPIHREALALVPDNSIQEVFYKSSVVGSSWPIPAKERWESSVRSMIKSVRSGALEPYNAITQTASQLKSAYPPAIQRSKR